MPYERQPQVLRFLAEHGPLSARGLTACLNPAPGLRALRYILKRLHDKELLSRRYDRVAGRVYHQIAQNPMARRLVAAILEVPAERLEQPQFRHAELLHSEDCAIWCEYLRHFFPTARVRRDYQFAAYAEHQGLLLSRGEDRDLLPDLLLTTPTEDGRGFLAVAIEIERTAKSADRLTRKLRKYAEQSRLDGIIYVCSSDSLQDKLLGVYRDKVAERALRISHYAENFFLFADGTADRTLGEPMMFNAAWKYVSLREWLRTLGETKNGGRRDSIFHHRSSARNDVVPLEKSHSDTAIVEKTST